MLKYDEDSKSAKILAAYYARQVGGELLLNFMTGQAELSSKEQAIKIIQAFWQMTDLAIDDNQAGKQIEGIVDIEFWMHKLFIKANGYMAKNGFDEEWNASVDER